MATSPLDKCLIPEFDYTCRDKVLLDLLDVTTFTITLEPSSNNIIFGNQYYD